MSLLVNVKINPIAFYGNENTVLLCGYGSIRSSFSTYDEAMVFRGSKQLRMTLKPPDRPAVRSWYSRLHLNGLKTTLSSSTGRNRKCSTERTFPVNNFLRWARQNMIPQNIGPKEFGLMRILVFFLLFLSSSRMGLDNFAESTLTTYCVDIMGTWANLNYGLDTQRTLLTIFKFSLLMAAVGFLTPLAFLTSAITFFLANMYALKFCYSNHAFLPLVNFLIIWTLVDTSSGFRLDNLIWRKKGSQTAKEVGVSVFALQVYVCLIYFAAGYTKMRNVGWPWIASDSLLYMLTMQNFYMEFSRPRAIFSSFNEWLANYKLLVRYVAFDVIVIEILAPLALFGRRFSRIIIPHLVLLMVGIYVFFYIDFREWLIMLLVWPNFSPLIRIFDSLINRLPLKKKPAHTSN